MDISNYTFKDFIAYVMIFAAGANFEISPEEKEHIVSKVGEDEFNAMLELFETHNDIESIEFILELEKLHVEEGEESQLLNVIKETIFADGEQDELEQNTFIALTRLLKL